MAPFIEVYFLNHGRLSSMVLISGYVGWFEWELEGFPSGRGHVTSKPTAKEPVVDSL
jgi:hypothetical protein